MNQPYSMAFVNVFGGPCPVCDLHGELKAHFTDEPGGVHMRVIVHRDGAGRVHACELPVACGSLSVFDEWRFIPS